MKLFACCVLASALSLFPVGLAQEKETAGVPTPQFRFIDVTAETGLEAAFRGAFNHAIAWGDFDGDGRLDLFLGNFADRSPRLGMKHAPGNMLMRQTAAGKFERHLSPSIDIAGRCSGAVFADFDNDGRLDLIVTSNTTSKPGGDEYRRAAKAQGSKLYRNDGNGKFVDVSQTSGACPASLIRCRDIGVFDYDGDGLLDLLILQDKGIDPEDKIPGVRLFRNLRGFRFEETTAKAGLTADLWGTGIAVADLNGDHRPDFYLCGVNRLYLSQPDKTYREAKTLRPLFVHEGKGLDWTTGAVFGDLNLDGNFDLVIGCHPYEGPARVHVFLNEGLKDGVPQFREITKEIGIPALPQKAPHPEIQDFDNDGIPDLYWSCFFAEGDKRWPFICKGLGVKDGLPRFDVPKVPDFDLEMLKKNAAPPKRLGMIYYVNGPAVDYNGDGRLDLCCGIWPDEPSRLFRNETKTGNWLQVRVEGKKMNRMGVGAQVRVFRAQMDGAENRTLLGFQEITLNGGYSSGRPAIAHFGLGNANSCDVEVTIPGQPSAIVLRKARVNQALKVWER
jgi:hypothetical protein